MAVHKYETAELYNHGCSKNVALFKFVLNMINVNKNQPLVRVLLCYLWVTVHSVIGKVMSTGHTILVI